MAVVAAGAHELDPGPSTLRRSPWPPRTPFPSPTKLRPTRRAWLLLWLTAALVAVADEGLLLREASVTVMVEGRSRSLPAGLTVAQVLERLELPAMAGDLLAVDHSVLRKNAYPPRVLVTASRREQPDASNVATESRWPAARAGSSP
jgi:sulfur carrier protein ThiS